MAVIVWQLDLPLPMQSVHITTDIVSLNLDQGEVHKIMWYSLSVTCDRSVVFSGSSYFFQQKTDRHDITEILLKVALDTINSTNQPLIIKH